MIVVGCQAVFLLLLWLALRKTARQSPFKELQASDHKKYEDMIEAETTARIKTEEELVALAAEQKKILDWWKRAEGKVNREVQDEFQKLVTDPDALDRKLDSLLSGNSEDTTEPDTHDTEEGG